MKNNNKAVLSALALSLFLSAPSYSSFAQSNDSSDMQQVMDRLSALEKLVKSQQQTLDDQKKKIAVQEKELKTYKKAENDGETTAKEKKHHKSKNAQAKASSNQPMAAASAAVAPKAASQPAPQTAETGTKTASASGTSITAPPETQEKQRPQINVLPDAGGVLTPKGVLMYENSLEYTNTTNNVFTFDGVQVSSVVLVGNINATSARRQLMQDSSRFRMGLTDRLEADVRVPYVYRNDQTTSTIVGGSSNSNRIEGHDIGDIDMGLAYQINQGREGWPFFVANLRYKSDTGTGPYDVAYDNNNIALSLPTGTGFHSAETSLTVIKVTDPAVLFANLGYVHSFGRDIDKTFNTTRILDVTPGSAINFSGGLGFSINQDTSFTLGYKHSYVFGTEQTAMDTGSGSVVKTKTNDLNVGALLIGASYRVTPQTNVNFTVEVGATRDAPDVHIGLRVPFELAQFY